MGIYSDMQGHSCSLTDASPGFINAYVVVRPGPSGVSGVQFAAPKPACFAAAYIGDQQVPGALVAGNSQDGVAVVLPQCVVTPVHMLTMRFYGYGNTAACCEYPVVAAPVPGSIEVVDCNFVTTTGSGVVSTINADASCTCTGNSPPLPPDSPQPADGEPAASVAPLLAWHAGDVDGNLAEYDVYLGTDPVPPLLVSGVPQNSYAAGPLSPFTQYYWRVVARDARGLETSSPAWSFTTRAVNTPPATPGLPSPAHQSVDQPVDEPLSWRCSDIDGDTLVFDVYFGISSSPPLVAANETSTGYFPGTLAFTTPYYWRVVARDSHGAETAGPEWSFVTRPANYPPIVPTGPNPWNGATNQPRSPALQWWSSDADGHAITYDVYLGDTDPPPLVAAGQSARSYAPGPLQFETEYFWKIVARDELGAESTGPVWHFTVKANSPPQSPSSPAPPNAGANRPLDQKLAWSCSDVDGGVITYDVFFGTVSPPPPAASGRLVKSYDPGPLLFATTYYWRIVARDDEGAETVGAVWRFTTAPPSQPPHAPSSPTPPFNAINRPVVQQLAWVCTDPENDPLVFDVYLGAASPPPLLASNLPVKYFLSDTLQYDTQYFWRVVARDVGGGETSGVEWKFTTQPENYLSSTPSSPHPVNNASGVVLIAGLSWSTTPPPGEALVYDVFLGTDASPPLVAGAVQVSAYQPAELAPETHYFWKIRARSTTGLESTGPVWNFTTGPNRPPVAPQQPFPPDDSLAPIAPVLGWTSSDPEGKPLSFDVYLAPAGTAPVRVAQGLATPSFAPGTLAIATTYTWLVVASDGHTSAVGPAWQFTASIPGDTDQDGVVSLQDAACALRLFAQQVSCVPNLPGFADVDCDGALTPGDALCIHRYAADGSCAFCDVVGASAAGAGATPAVSAAGAWQVGDTLTVSLRFSGVPLLHAAGMRIEFAQNIQLLGVSPGAAAADYTDFVASAFSGAGLAGGYSLDGIAAGTEFARLRLVVPPAPLVVYLDDFSDDLEGAPRLSVVWNGTASAAPAIPAALSLGQNRPNPFNPATAIPYTLPAETPVLLTIHDASGRVVRRLVDARLPGGPHEVTWDGRDDHGGSVSSGIYFCVLDAGGERRTRKLVLLK